jgi:cell division protein FtsZ
VIATGIGAPCQEANNPLDASFKVRQFEPRGTVRDITDEDIRNSRQANEPDMFKSEPKNERTEDGRIIRHKGLVIDQEDLEIPTFLRRGAD